LLALSAIAVTDPVALPQTESAMRRLEQALARLDAHISAQPGDDLFLAGALKSVRAEYKELEDVTRDVSERLDATIGRLRKVLAD
jgi:hypothetical protein